VRDRARWAGEGAARAWSKSKKSGGGRRNSPTRAWRKERRGTARRGPPPTTRPVVLRRCQQQRRHLAAGAAACTAVIARRRAIRCSWLASERGAPTHGRVWPDSETKRVPGPGRRLRRPSPLHSTQHAQRRGGRPCAARRRAQSARVPLVRARKHIPLLLRAAGERRATQIRPQPFPISRPPHTTHRLLVPGRLAARRLAMAHADMVGRVEGVKERRAESEAPRRENKQKQSCAEEKLDPPLSDPPPPSSSSIFLFSSKKHMLFFVTHLHTRHARGGGRLGERHGAGEGAHDALTPLPSRLSLSPLHTPRARTRALTLEEKKM
jgi:hypothetical protein